MPLPDWSRAYSAPLLSGAIRQSPLDFDVTEELGFEFDDQGEHDFLYVEKTGANTEWLSRQLASFAKVPVKDVGYSGLKDRNAITRQWFSVPRWHQPDWSKLQVEGATLKDQQRHSRKLRRGSHRHNRFKIVVRDIDSDFDDRQLLENLEQISSKGVPNYFGPQRFGRNGANVQLADSWSAGKRLPRHKRSIAISSARSFMFNEYLQRRVLDGTWNHLLAAEVANLDGSGSVFNVEELDETLVRRCAELDIHPTGVLFGDGANEDDIASDYQHWCVALKDARVKASHRSLRLRISDMDWVLGDSSLTLSFKLTRGAFATSVLREIVSTQPRSSNT